MATETLATISNAMSTTFAPQIERQWNRLAVAAAGAVIQAGAGPKASWDVALSGATAVTVAEGSDVPEAEFSHDIVVPASMDWAHYRHSFKVSETMIDALATAQAIPTALEDIFGERIMNGAEVITSKISRDIYVGTGVDGGGNTTLFGVTGGGAIDSSGSYAGISRATYPEWSGNVLANGGTLRALTPDLLAQADELIFTRAGDMWDEIWASPGVYRRYEGMFTASAPAATNTGAQGGNYGFGATGLYYKGRPVRRDKDMPPNSMIFVTKNKIRFRYLPRLLNPRDAVYQGFVNAGSTNGQDGEQTLTRLPIRIALLGKTGDNIKCTMKVSLQMIVTRPGAFCWIKDVAET